MEFSISFFIGVIHYNPEANKCTDALTKRVYCLFSDFILFEDLPFDVLLLLEFDNSVERSNSFVRS